MADHAEEHQDKESPWTVNTGRQHQRNTKGLVVEEKEHTFCPGQTLYRHDPGTLAEEALIGPSCTCERDLRITITAVEHAIRA